MKIKKALGLVLVAIMSMFPVMGKAAEKINLDNYETLGLKEALKSEKIEEVFKSYSENDSQINIYLFRGQGCRYCKAFLTFLDGITEEYGKYFKLVSFESWYDSANADLLKNISSFVNNPAQGVPYIIIGENVFPGYASDYDESIKSAIVELYNAKDRYDVFEAYNDSLKKSAGGDTSTTTVVIWNLVFTAISTIIIVITIKKTLRNNSNNLVKEDVIITEEKKETETFNNKKNHKKIENKSVEIEMHPLG